MSPLRPVPGAWATTTSDPGASPTDEWLDEEYPPGPDPRVTREECREALSLLAELPELVGPIPVEIHAMLATLIHERGAASAFLLRSFRSLDGLARS